MIFGIGTDVVQIERIERLHARYGEHFVQRLLLPAELEAFRAQSRSQSRAARFLAMRFAAKEAIVKAMGTGFRHGLWIRDIGVAANEFGRPDIIWSERGQQLRERLGIGEGHITLTDEAGLVVAVAILMRRNV
ncbi:holo-ACP synthase [Steroidobacter sp. S1-65]|uniref:Holo-[acyl-carrier-protein] synthase n=1 Tax=Steroidobacter gossypii TaxID=2805490 RepID=A0ABS1WVY4_9GAMM|nr:holo-ACP synthase [Steroidobacter gossypii]MBM0105129.1 holo-ACP synthase [Steroidobacter gossypii]